MTERISQQLINTDPKGRLGIELLGRYLPSPLILGSGTLAERHEQIQPYIDAGAGAVIPRSTRKVMERKVHPSPHLYQTGRKGNEMMLNAEWTGASIEYWQPHLDEMAKGGQVIMSVSGRDIPGCTEVCKTIDQFNFPLIEVNVSCAHSNNAHGFITRNGQHIGGLIKSIKDAGVTTPIALKLGHSDHIVELSNIAKEAGVDAITAINTFGPLLDFTIDEHGMPQPVLGIASGKGGMSGAPLFNIALTDVAEIRRQVDIPVIGCGGVRTAEDAMKMMMAGASAVQVYTAAHVKGVKGPQVFADINKELVAKLESTGVENVGDLVDRAQPILGQQTNLEPQKPFVDKSKCTGCDTCVPICLQDAITIHDFANKRGHVASINDESCVGCGHCVTVCPSNAIEI